MTAVEVCFTIFSDKAVPEFWVSGWYVCLAKLSGGCSGSVAMGASAEKCGVVLLELGCAGQPVLLAEIKPLQNGW